MRPQSLLLAAENVPHFINKNTRARTLECYRKLHRELGHIEDSFAKSHLKLLTQHNFSRFKFIADTKKVNALLDYAETHELMWIQEANSGSHKDLNRILQIAYTNYGVRESPLKQVLQTYKPMCDHKAPAFKLNNIQTPKERSFESYVAKELAVRNQDFSKIDSRFWQLVKLLQKGHPTPDKPKRKLVIKLEDLDSPLLTVLGTPISQSRQANVLKKLYAKLLRDSPRPQHPHAMAQLEKQLRDKTLSRKTRRRLKELSKFFYTVDKQGIVHHTDPFI